MRGDGRHLIERGIGIEQQCLMDVNGNLSENLGARSKGKGIEHCRNRALEGVLDGDNTVVGLAALDSLENLGQRVTRQ